MRPTAPGLLLASGFFAVQLSAQTPPPPPPPPPAGAAQPPPGPPPGDVPQPGATPAPAPTGQPSPYTPPPYAPPGPPPPPPPGGEYHEPPPPPEPPANRSERRHDGFYLRLGIGSGYGTVITETSDSGFDLKGTLTGWGPAYELMLGGTPGGGFVIGGGFVGQDISDPKYEVELGSTTLGTTTVESGVEEGKALGILLIGPFLDWFPDDEGGFHFGLMLGAGGIGLSDEKGDAATGGGGALWVGYDFWIASQWSLGAEGRAVSVATRREFADTKFDDRASSVELLFTGLYH